MNTTTTDPTISHACAFADSERARIISALADWIHQRPGLKFGNYGDVSAYRAEIRSITNDLHQARILLRAVEYNTTIDATRLKESFRAFSGRLSWNGSSLDYCTDQYWPTEYRRAACAVLASALWDWTRELAMPEPTYIHYGSLTELPMRTEARYAGKSAGDWLRAHFVKEFGRTIARRWFN